ncbi:hypothetical protein Tco_1486423, partial [Tanacetum coccineum]
CDQIERVTNIGCKEGSETLMICFDSFNYDTPLEMELISFVNWWTKKEKDDTSYDEKSYYNPHEEWRLWMAEKENSIKTSYEKIEKNELLLDDHDYDWMFDYFLSKYGPAFMRDDNEEVEENKFKLIGTP